MTNPFSDKGWSDKDYARAVGTLMGEAWGGSKNPASTLSDYELIADVIMNRKESNHPSYKGKSIDQLLRSPKEFAAWGKKQKDARAMATKGMVAVLGKREDKLTGIAKQKHDLAVKALDNIVGNQSRRGVAKGADRYNNPKAGPSPYHDDEARKHGSVTAGMHRATGPDFGTVAGPAPYSQYGEWGTPKEAIPPEARAPYSPSGLTPDWGLGDEGFGAKTYPEISAGLYPDIAPPNVPPVPDIMGQFDLPNMMTEQQAIENANLEGQRLSENVERRQAPFGETVDEQVERNAAAAETNDYLSALYSEIGRPVGVGAVNPASFTSNPYEVPGDLPAGPRPGAVDKGVWGGTTPFNDRFTGASRATPTFVDYENRAPLAGLGIGGIASPGPVGMAKAGGVGLQRDISGISSGMYPYEAVFEAVRNAPTTAQMSAGAPPAAPGYVGGTTAQLGTPDFSAASALDREAAYQAEVAAMRDPAATQARGAWADQAEVGPRPAGPDPTSFQGGLYGDPATPAGGFTPGLDFSQPVGPSPDRFSGGPAEVAFNERISDSLRPGPTAPAEMSPFQNTPLGVGAGIIDQGPYSSPLGPNPNSFAPSNLAPAAVSTQAPAAPTRGIVDYDTKTITKDVPNPAWSEWSKDYATANASQNAWAAADEDKRAWDRAPPNPSVLADTRWAGLGQEPPKTIAQTTTVRSPVYGDIPASVPAVNAQPVAGSAIQAQPSTWTPGMTQQAQNFSSLLGSIGGYGLQGVPGTFDTGFNLAGLGGGGYGGFGGGYDPGGYGGYGGISPGDAGYGSDARSGSGNMGAGNLYQ